MQDESNLSLATFIYGIVHPIRNELVYVGRTKSGFKRPRSHWGTRGLKFKDRFHSWLKKYIRLGMTPEIVVLEECAEVELNDREIFWIASLRSVGAILLNDADGGNGRSGHKLTAEHRRKIGNGNRGKPLSSERKEKIRRALMGQKLSPDHVKAISESRKGKPKSHEHRAKIAESNRRTKALRKNVARNP